MGIFFILFFSFKKIPYFVLKKDTVVVLMIIDFVYFFLTLYVHVFPSRTCSRHKGSAGCDGSHLPSQRCLS